tara:strand:+ start:350 stop:1495 length:1146 start_codon:yes stop_codon:yes gene_type:complete
MRALKWIGITIVALLAVATAAIVIGLYLTRPEPPPENSQSAARLDDGPYSVGQAEFDWVDTSRPTPPNGDYAGSEERALPTVIWYPEDFEGSAPLVIYSHGFRSDREGGAYIAEYLASHGNVVASARFPLSNGAAPGGPTISDVPSQPGDVSFLIDQMLSLSGDDKPFTAELDADRIAAIGLSLGGLTTTLTTFHPEWRDPRIKAAVSMAGPADVFGPDFFDTSDAAYLVISGTEDAIVPHRTNSAPIPGKLSSGGLLEIEGGTHAGFADLMSGPVRLLGNPDELACSVVEFNTDGHPFDGMFGGPELGLVSPDEYVPACSFELGDAISAGRQHMIAKLAIRALLESAFAETEEGRRQSQTYLTDTLPSDFPETRYLPAQR